MASRARAAAPPPAKPAPSIYDLRDDVRSALIVVDVQRDWFSASAAVRSAFPELPANLEELLDIFRSRGLPVVHVRARYDCPVRSGHMSFFTKLNPEKPAVVSVEPEPFAAERLGELVVYKPTFDGFHDTELHAELQRMRVGRVYVCGLVTAACVLNTCFGAFRLGYEVVLASECTADRSRAQHDAIINIYNGYTFIAAGLAELASFVRAPADVVAGAPTQPELSAPELHSPKLRSPELRLARELPLQRGRGPIPDSTDPLSCSSLSVASSISSSTTLSSFSSSSAGASSVASEVTAPSSAPLISAQPRASRLATSLGGLALLARSLSVGVYCIAAGHGLDERLMSPMRSPLRALGAAAGISPSRADRARWFPL
ncbi:hypothetical protein KFE25_002828 [Diacronema lutheri]|uniref:Isochorismatase-like domain-containing protein n=1 Tax=Diacronema lutheri TaxID=2081491 RepID=A0A8J5XBE4_DIALT|nr:hypothetical protein KFE25_002828 [Diacronema lutheri]